ncbi:TetR/AcrR family transcriptional regulator [Roseibium alexandrii]|uniref:TetR/AcrR family transcriptional regulator n=1 Tax=Roseibium alexandrii TaxID=388408 RepID=UPI0037514112
MATAKTKQKILTVFLELLEKHPYEEVSLQLIAETAKVKLSDLRRAYPSKLALVEAFSESIDAAVLDERDEGMDDQPARDRLFDILMTRIDALADHKEAVRALKTAADEDPGLALEFNRIAIRSQKWMLVAAGIDLSGAKGTVVAQGLVMAFAKVVATWLDEPDEGMPRTMARLDKELDNGVSFMKRLNRLEGMAKGLRKFIKSASKRGRSRSRARDDDDFADHTETPMPSEQGA